MYALLLDKNERQTLALQQQHTTLLAAGHQVQDEWPSLDAARENLDALLDAEPELSAYSPQERELLELLGVGRG